MAIKFAPGEGPATKKTTSAVPAKTKAQIERDERAAAETARQRAAADRARANYTSTQ
jgi:hypothetical protein